MNTLLSEKPQVKFKTLSSKMQLAIIVVSMAFLGLISYLLMVPVQKTLLGGNYTIFGFLMGMLTGKINPTDSTNFELIKSILFYLIIAFVISTVDTIISIVVIIIATINKDYPAPHNKTNWLTGLWGAFIFMQAPTGIPSAFIYWYYIARVKKKNLQQKPAEPGGKNV